MYFGTTAFPNGAIGPCCLSNEEGDDFGKLSPHVGFAEIWNNDRYRAARALRDQKDWSQRALVCGRCPDRKAMDYQFRTTLQALLRNAPDWVLKVIRTDTERFFFAIDHALSPLEFGALRACDPLLNSDFTQEHQWLADRIAQASPTVAARLAWIQNALKSPPMRRPSIRTRIAAMLGFDRTVG